MKLGITTIVLAVLLWCWMISSAPDNPSFTQQVASLFLLGMFVMPGVKIIQQALSEQKRKKSS